jgi:alkylhydroperoxidase family enzyme
VRRQGAREVDVDTQAGPLRVRLWNDNWVLAWRRSGGEAVEEVFDVFARNPADLVSPLVGLGLTEQAAVELAQQLIAERAAMDQDESQR